MSGAQHQNISNDGTRPDTAAETRIAVLAEQLRSSGVTAATIGNYGAAQLREHFHGRTVWVAPLEEARAQKALEDAYKQAVHEIDLALVAADVLPCARHDYTVYSINAREMVSEATIKARQQQYDAYWQAWAPIKQLVEHALYEGWWKEFDRITEAQKSAPPTAPTAADVQVQQAVPRFYNFDDMLHYAINRNWVVRNLLPAGEMMAVVGAPNSGKTTLWQHGAACVAVGHPFGRHETTARRVVWIAGEDASNVMKRFRATIDHHGFDAALFARNLCVVPTRQSLNEEANISAIQQGIRQAWGDEPNLGLIVIDSKSALSEGLDENDNDATALFVRRLYVAFIDRYPGCSLVIMHHLNKDPENPTARGASAFQANIDEMATVTARPGAMTIVMEPTKTRIERWEPMRAQMAIHELSGAHYEHWRDEFGGMPRVSIIELAAPLTGAARKIDQQERLALRVLAAWRDYPGPEPTAGQIALSLGLVRPKAPNRGDSKKLTAAHRIILDRRWAVNIGKPGRTITGSERLQLTKAGHDMLALVGVADEASERQEAL